VSALTAVTTALLDDRAGDRLRRPLDDRAGDRLRRPAALARRSARAAVGHLAAARPRLLRGLLWTVVVVCGGAYAASLAVPLWYDLHGQRLLVVTSGSMAPSFRAGDAVVLQDVAPSRLRVGQVVSFWPHGSDELVTHRIEALTTLPLLDQDHATGRMVPVLDAETGEPILRDYLVTRGDANAERDPDAVPLSRVRGIVLEVHRGWGAVLSWTTSTDGRLALLAPPLLAIAAMEVGSVLTARRRPAAPARLDLAAMPAARTGVTDDLLLG
jgi:signal peptidase I